MLQDNTLSTPDTTQMQGLQHLLAVDSLLHAQDEQLVKPLGPAGRGSGDVVLDPQETTANNFLLLCAMSVGNTNALLQCQSKCK